MARAGRKVSMKSLDEKIAKQQESLAKPRKNIKMIKPDWQNY